MTLFCFKSIVSCNLGHITHTMFNLIDLRLYIVAWMFYRYGYSKTFHLGVLAPWNGFYAVGKHSIGAFYIAKDIIRSDNITFREINKAVHDFTFTYKDTECDPSIGIPEVAALLCDDDILDHSIDAFIGPVCSSVCEPAGYLARYWRKPMISFACVSNKLSNKLLYPTFARTSGPVYYAPLYVKFIQTLNYKRVAVFTTSVYIPLATSLREHFIKADISVTDYVSFGGQTLNKQIDIKQDLRNISQRCKGNRKPLYFTFLDKILEKKN